MPNKSIPIASAIINTPKSKVPTKGKKKRISVSFSATKQHLRIILNKEENVLPLARPRIRGSHSSASKNIKPLNYIYTTRKILKKSIKKIIEQDL